MTPKRKSYVTFESPGTLFNEGRYKEVAERNPENIEVPEGAFAFQFFDEMVATIEVDGESMTMTSPPFNRSAKYYYGGHILTVEDVEREIPNNKTLLSNMRGNNWKTVIQTRRGNIQPFEDGDILIEEAA